MKTLMTLVGGFALLGALAGCGDDTGGGTGGAGGGAGGGSGGDDTSAETTGQGTGSTASGQSTSTGNGGNTTSTASGEGGGGDGGNGAGGGGIGGGESIEVEIPEEIAGSGDGKAALQAVGELLTELGDPAIPDLVQIEVWDDATPGTQELDSELNQGELYQRAVFVGVDVEEVDGELVPAEFFVAVEGQFTLGENDIFNASGDIQLTNVVLLAEGATELTITEADVTIIPLPEEK